MTYRNQTDFDQLSEGINQQIADCYGKACTILLDDNSYRSKVETRNINRYIAFVDLSLQRPYNRISNIAAFIRDEDGLMSSRMYPLSFLHPDAKAEIDELYRRSEQLAASLDIAGDQVGYMRLEIEPHEV